jgi:hypothetical protein
MKKIFNPIVASLLVAAFALCAVVAVQAQNRERHVISAKAGGINDVSGNVIVKRRGEAQTQRLTSKDDLDSGDMVTTGLDGRVEVLLNPGSYLRVPENSEFELTDASLDGLRVRLLRGSAILEATGADGMELLIQLETPQTKVAIVKRGLYRINVLAEGATEVLVRKGRALVGGAPLIVKDGKKIVIGSGPAEITKFDKKNQDQFDLWSKERAETLAQANRRLSRRALTSIFASYDDAYWNSFLYGGRAGVWVYNAALRCYTFLPFYSGWGSPYGGSYSSGFYIWTPPNGGGRGGGGGSGSGGSGGGQPRRIHPPPNPNDGSGGEGPRPVRPPRPADDGGGGQRGIRPRDPDRFEREMPRPDSGGGRERGDFGGGRDSSPPPSAPSPQIERSAPRELPSSRRGEP